MYDGSASKITYPSNRLHSAHYYTCSGSISDVFLKVSKALLEFHTDRRLLEMAENLCERVVSSMFSTRLVSRTNKNLEEFDDTGAGTNGFLVDAYNLYDGVMQKFLIPFSDFETVDAELSSILETANDSESSTVIEVNMNYTDAFRNMGKDFSVTSMQEEIDRDMMSEYQMGLLN